MLGTKRTANTAVPAHADQAVALRRRWLCHPLVAHADPLQFAGCGVWHRRADCAERRICWALTSPSTSSAWMRPTPTSISRGAGDRALSRHGGNFGLICLTGVQSNEYPRALDTRAAVPGGRHPGRHRRLPCLGLPIDAATGCGRPTHPAAGHGPRDVRRRGGGAARTRLARRGGGHFPPVYDFLKHLPGWKPAPRRQFCRSGYVERTWAAPPASTPGAAAPINVRSAPSSTCRGASRASLARRAWRPSCGRTGPKASTSSSSPTTISPATRIGRQSSTG